MKALALLLALATTEGPPSYELHKMPENTLVAPWPKTEAECVDKARASEGKWQCVVRRNFETVATCDGVAKPAMPRELDADGYLVKPPIRAKQVSDTEWLTEVQDYVPASAPACWVLGWRLLADADLNDEFSDVLVQEPVVWPGDVVT